MADRQGKCNSSRIPHRKNEYGKWLCRSCGSVLSGRKTSFCDHRCLRDFYMKTDWQRVRRVVYARDGGVCMICGKKTGATFHVDHINPISNGGDEWDLLNLQLACRSCNLTKGSKTEEQMMAMTTSIVISDDPSLEQLMGYREQFEKMKEERLRVDMAIPVMARWIRRGRSILDCMETAKRFIKTGQWPSGWEESDEGN